MRRSPTLATWLVLVVTLLSGLAPARELVLCVEPGGTVALELAEASGCTPCGDSGSTSEGESLGVECCPCTDIPLPAQADDPQVRGRSLSQEIGPVWTMAPPLCVLAVVADFRAGPVPARTVPRPAEGLARIRTVELRV